MKTSLIAASGDTVTADCHRVRKDMGGSRFVVAFVGGLPLLSGTADVRIALGAAISTGG